MISKQSRFRSKTYTAFVRTLPCCLCGTDKGIAAHHLKGIWHMSGGGLKAPDSYVMPLCDGPGGCHAQVHASKALRDMQPEWLLWTLTRALKEQWPAETRDALTEAREFVRDRMEEAA